MENSNPNQCKRIVRYVHGHGGITGAEAFMALGIERLPARIWELENRYNVPIERNSVQVTNRFGKKVHVSRYSFEITEELLKWSMS